MRRGSRTTLLAAMSQGRQPPNGQVDQPQEAAPQPPAPIPELVPGPVPASVPGPVPRPVPSSQVSQVTRTARGRGGRSLISQMAAMSVSKPVETQQPVVQPPPTRLKEPTPANEPSSESESSGTPRGRLSRQGSDVSRSSVLSQQFAPVEKINYKSNLPKEPSATGAPVQLSLNYMTFNTSEDFSIQEYHVDFNPNIESISLRYNIIRSQDARQIIGNVCHWTGTNLYLPHKLPQSVMEFATQHPVTNNTVRVKLSFVKTPPFEELIPFYNSLMHKVMNKLRYVIINRQHYSPIHKIAIEQYKLEVWPGWITAIQRLDGGLKLSIDASFRVLRLETVRDLMKDIHRRCRGGGFREALEQQLVGTTVMTRYNNKAYRIDAIDLDKKPTDTFNMSRDGGEKLVSYIDYMRQQWNVEIQDRGQPLLIHRPKPKRGQEEPHDVLLVPELCVTTGLTDEMRSNFSIMKAIGEHTRLPPDVRESKLVEFLQQISTDERAKSVLADWNLSVKPTLDVVPGRKLDTETVIFGESRTFRVPDNVDWTRAALSGPVFKSVDIDQWVIMFTESDSNVAKDFMNCVKDVSRNLCVRFQAPRVVLLPNDNPMTYVNAGKREVKKTDQMVVILTPGKSQREDRYSACKRLYSCEIPVPCQFIRCGTISNPNRLRSIVQKIVIQVLSKVGGQPWAMKFPMKSFMIVGLDVYHDTIDRNKSCVGFVASMNEFTSSWWSRTFFQNSLEEIGQRLNVTLMAALRKFHSLNGFVPEKVIVYRDGVGDGQLNAVLDFEVVQAMNAIKFYMRDCDENVKEPHFSYVVIQKRINAKLSLRSGGRIMNPQPGTYLDHTITHPEYNDFYLVSQHVNQGTVSPTKYIVLTETGNLKLMHHQKLAYKMTHMYFNWTGTIRVPAPCQYAHKLAYLTGQNIRQPANERLEDKLYYL